MPEPAQSSGCRSRPLQNRAHAIVLAAIKRCALRDEWCDRRAKLHPTPRQAQVSPRAAIDEGAQVDSIPHRRESRAPLWLATVLSLVCLGFGPCGRIPGTRLSGQEVTQPVTDWSFVEQIPECQIEVRPSEPYSINAMCFPVGGDLFVGCMHCAGKRWPTYLQSDPRLRVKLGDRIYPLRATRVTDPAVIQGAWEQRSRRRLAGPPPPVPADYWLFRFGPR